MSTGVQVLEPAFPFKTMKTFLCLLGVAGLLATTGCEIEGHGRGGYYGPTEYGHGEYHHDGYWDRGHYYYHDDNH